MNDAPNSPRSFSRRALVQGGVASLSLAASAPLLATTPPRSAVSIDLLRQPDLIRVFVGETSATAHPLERSGEEWSAAGVHVSIDVAQEQVTLAVHAPAVALQRIHLRWNGRLSERLMVLGDAWERSYGDLAWLPLQAERALPWYCLVHDGASAHGFGVKTGAAAFAFWQVDDRGISLWLDVRNGGNGVQLGERTLPLATVVTHRGVGGESAFHATQQLCRRMASEIHLPRARGGHALNAIYGSNDWYYAYGRNTAEGILRDADLMGELAPAGAIRPLTAVDEGYHDRARFPDMAALAQQIRSRSVLPGVWIRPLRAAAGTSPNLLLPTSRWGSRQERANELAFDPTIPEARAAVLAVVQEARDWGYDLIKHDFTTYELLGQWGSEMNASPTVGQWNFHDRSQTNAEIISSLYRDIRTAAGEDSIVLGCNTVAHLAAGIFDAQRTGDDVSGRLWERTRRMGVNTLAFRLPQHRVFFAVDADCVPITRDVPWQLTRQWLEAVAASGTVLLVSPEPGAVGAEQKRALRDAFALCVSAKAGSEPADWVSTRTPAQWGSGVTRKQYEWTEVEGASPFSV